MDTFGIKQHYGQKQKKRYGVNFESLFFFLAFFFFALFVVTVGDDVSESLEEL